MDANRPRIRPRPTLNFNNDLRDLLFAAGAPVHPDITNPYPDSLNQITHPTTQNRTSALSPFGATSTDALSSSNLTALPLPETVRVLDEIVTDFIIETSLAAHQISVYANRQKVKLSDFEFVLRKDRKKLGRVQEMARRNRKMKEARKQVGETGEQAAPGRGRMMGMAELEDLVGIAGEEVVRKGVGRGRGRRRKKGGEKEEDVELGGERKSLGVDEGMGDVSADEDELEEMEVDSRPKKSRSELG